jgi:hypothetical protein
VSTCCSATAVAAAAAAAMCEARVEAHCCRRQRHNGGSVQIWPVEEDAEW